MSAKSKIQWTERTWNPVRGCAIVSPGCTNCYAMRQAHRFSGSGQSYEGLTRMTSRGPVWTGKIRLVREALEEPLRWKKPSRVFVNSMSDLFHEDVPTDFQDEVFAMMALAHEHTFQILTKRPEQAKRYLETKDPCCLASAAPEKYPCSGAYIEDRPWPLPNVWLGVSVESRSQVDRIATLQQTPAAVRFVSFEPLLDDIGPVCLDGIDWAIFGGESGPGARPCHLDWIRLGLSRCRSYGVAPFVKQVGSHPHFEHHPQAGEWGDWNRSLVLLDRKGGDPSEWPEDLRVREYPSNA